MLRLKRITYYFYYMNKNIAPDGLYIFDGLSDREIAYFIMMSETIYEKSGEIIINEGDASDDRAYFIESGSVDIYRSGEKIATLGSGDLFGELALITNEPRTATVKVSKNVELLAFSKDEFLMLYQKSDLYESIKFKILGRVKENFYKGAK